MSGIFSFIVLFTLSLGQTPSQEMEASFDYRIEPLVDLMNYVREQATRRGAPDHPPEFNNAIAAARKVNEKLGGFTLAWGDLDRELILCRSANQLKAAWGKLKPIEMFDGSTVEIKKEALDLAHALSDVEPYFMKSIWPNHEAAIKSALHRIERAFRPKEKKCLAFMAESLGMNDLGGTVPVFLIHNAMWPGAFTFEGTDGTGICFVEITRETLKGSLLFETILHEGTHAFDARNRDGNSVFQELRESLQKAGMSPRDGDFRNIPHTIMFIQAGETIRRMVDSEHIHYGVASGYYARLGKISEVERDVWLSYLDGKLSRDGAVKEIVSRLTGK